MSGWTFIPALSAGSDAAQPLPSSSVNIKIRNRWLRNSSQLSAADLDLLNWSGRCVIQLIFTKRSHTVAVWDNECILSKFTQSGTVSCSYASPSSFKSHVGRNFIPNWPLKVKKTLSNHWLAQHVFKRQQCPHFLREAPPTYPMWAVVHSGNCSQESATSMCWLCKGQKLLKTPLERLSVPAEVECWSKLSSKDHDWSRREAEGISFPTILWAAPCFCVSRQGPFLCTEHCSCVAW